MAETDAHLIETAMARVVMACALKHHTRRGERDPERWQTPSQLVTHALLRDAGFTLPSEAEVWEDLGVDFPPSAVSYYSGRAVWKSVTY